MTEQLLTWMVYDDADDFEHFAPKELTKAADAGARYFYAVPDTGGSWYVLLATDAEMTEAEVQHQWELEAEEQWSS